MFQRVVCQVHDLNCLVVKLPGVRSVGTLGTSLAQATPGLGNRGVFGFSPSKAA